MRKMRSANSSLRLFILVVISCGFPQLPELSPGGGEGDWVISDGGVTDGEMYDGILIDAGSAPLSLELLAGAIGGPGNLDGIGAAARFNYPGDVAVDSVGNFYVADVYNYTIRKITTTGTVTTLAGAAGVGGSTDGMGTAARFAKPGGVAVDNAGNVYVADGNYTIRKVTATGVVTTLAGAAYVSGSNDGTGTAARFSSVGGVAVDSAGNVYVADTGNHTIRKITGSGVVTTLAGTAGVSGSTNGTGAAARFNRPSGVAVDSAGNIYVADYYNYTIRKVTGAGVVTMLAGTVGVSGSTDGTGAAARFSSPGDVAVDSAGNVYVADGFSNTIRKITGSGVVTTLAGTVGVSGSTDGTGAGARFYWPGGVAVDGTGTVYVADWANHTIRKITGTGVVTTLAGTASMLGSADGTGTAAHFRFPGGVAVDSTGNVYVADWGNHTIRKVTSAGLVTTLAGTAGMGGSTDGTGAAARFVFPEGVAVDSAGNVYVADNQVIRKVTSAGVVTTLAGTGGMPGSTDGTGVAARFQNPKDVAVDSAGNVYVADTYNATIRKITGAGVVTTLAGTAGVEGSIDGTGAAARFYAPTGIAVDSAGNIYVADKGNCTIRKVTSAGVVTTLAGSAGVRGSTDGTGAAARFYYPTDVAVDSAGDVYVADQDNRTIRKVTAAGVTTTIAGTVGRVGKIFGTSPGLAFPEQLAILGDSIVISDTHSILLLRHGAR